MKHSAMFNNGEVIERSGNKEYKFCVALLKAGKIIQSSFNNTGKTTAMVVQMNRRTEREFLRNTKSLGFFGGQQYAMKQANCKNLKEFKTVVEQREANYSIEIVEL